MSLKPLLLAVALVVALPAVAAPAPADVAGQNGASFTTELTGAAEVPGPGDPDGLGTARIVLNAGQERVCWELAVEDIDPATAAHIHRAPAGQAGGVVVALSAPTDGTSSGCTDADRDLIRDILTDPSQFYVNVHNAPFPSGALRGQLGR
jgi:hypothetical protein